MTNKILKRQAFSLPQRQLVNVKKKRIVGFLIKAEEEYIDQELVYKDKGDLMKQINSFIAKIGTENVVSVSEYKWNPVHLGGDDHFTITVFYWSNEE